MTDGKAISSKHEKGVVLVMVTITMVVMIMMLALVIDIGRLVILARQMQNAADAATLGGIQALEKRRFYTEDEPGAVGTPAYRSGDPIPNSVDLGTGWQQVKPIARFLLSHTRIGGAVNVTSSFLFNEGDSTQSDPVDWAGNAGSTATGQPGNLTLKVERGLVCFNDVILSGTTTNLDGQTVDLATRQKVWTTLDRLQPEERWCIANAVRTTVTVKDVNFFFGRILGAFKKDLMQRDAESHIRKSINPTPIPSGSATVTPVSTPEVCRNTNAQCSNCYDPPCSTYFNVTRSSGTPTSIDYTTFSADVACPTLTATPAPTGSVGTATPTFTTAPGTFTPTPTPSPTPTLTATPPTLPTSP